MEVHNGNHNAALSQAIEEVVAPSAAAVDADGAFPRAGIERLGADGILGLISSPDVGGAGGGMRAAAGVIEALAGHCGSTAMVVMMHYSATAVIEVHGDEKVRRAIAEGHHLTTLAFSESGSRAQFWVPMSTASANGEGVRLDASKSWVTSAGEADSYVWSSRPIAAEGPMTLWLVPADAGGLTVPARFDGLGLRGNASSPVTAKGTVVPAASMLGPDGGGLDVALTVVLPWFLVLNAAASLGLMEATVAETAGHLTRTRLEHLDQSLAEQAGPRSEVARMRLETDRTRALLDDTLTALETGRPDAMLRVLEIKAAAAESAIMVTDLAMKACGGAAFRKDLGIERRFRDARAARVMAPTTDALLDFLGRAILGLPLFSAASA